MQYNITYRQKDKGWQYIISYKDAKGLWKQKSKQGFDMKKTAKKAAEERLEQLKKEVKVAISVEPQYRGITFGEFAKELLEHEKIHKAHNTIASMQTAVKRFEGIKNISLTALKHQDIQICVDKLISEGIKISTIKLYVSRIQYILNQAVSPYKILVTTPMESIKIPLDQYVPFNDEKKALNKAKVKLLLKQLKKHPLSLKYYYFCSFALNTGLREGELLGLTWNDIDFSASQISVTKQWKILSAGKYGFGTLKKKNSKRVVPISLSTIKLLNEYKKEYPAIDINNRVFPFNNYHIVRFMIRVSQELGFPVTTHMLRHTYATNLIANGVDFKTAAALLGHDVEMTMRIYSHVTDDMMQQAAQKINSIF